MSGGPEVRRVVVVAGTRPEAVKVAPIVAALAATPGWSPILVSTGQHGDVLDRVFASFGLTVDVRHEPWQRSGELSGLHTALVELLSADLDRLEPDALIVQGDTASTLAGALAAFWQRIPVVHVEAGLRSGDLTAPFPEEANRRLVSQLAALHLAPTAAAAAALAREGIVGNQVIVTGNTVIDALRSLTITRPASSERRLVLVTCHRRENWGRPMLGVARAVQCLADKHADVDFVVAAHPNPAVRDVFEAALGRFQNVTITDPLDYLPFVELLARAAVVLTDSGGVQEEAPAFGVPVLVLRDVTERPEGIDAGVALLVGTEPHTITSAADNLLSNAEAHRAMAHRANPYGDGNAASRTVAAISWLLNRTVRPDEFAPGPSHRRGKPVEGRSRVVATLRR